MSIDLGLGDMFKAIIIKRPSATCKSPYVADIKLENSDEVVLAHTPALGCKGLSDKGATVYVSKIKDAKGVCKYRVQLGQCNDTIIGLNPKLAENIVEQSIMKSENVVKYMREKTVMHSRFDFIGKDKDNNKFVLEVKTVPLINQEKVAYFPDGYRKKKTEPVSPRALKHLNDLIQIVKETNKRCIMCYVIQRSDTEKFIPSDSDPIYKSKFYEAIEAGVEIKTLFVHWNKNGQYTMTNYLDFI